MDILLCCYYLKQFSIEIYFDHTFLLPQGPLALPTRETLSSFSKDPQHNSQENKTK